jgi:hypothetical protein
LESAARDEQTRELLSGITIAGSADLSQSNIFTTLVRHPGLFRKWTPFGGKLLAGKLATRDRELLILRTGWLCQKLIEIVMVVGHCHLMAMTLNSLGVQREAGVPGFDL